jgi:hypothetical protein
VIWVRDQLTGVLALLDLVLACGAVADFFGAGASCSIKCSKCKNGQLPGEMGPMTNEDRWPLFRMTGLLD